MSIYDTGTASLAANGKVTGVGTQWTMPLTLIRVGATIVFKTEPVQIYTISEITSDTSMSVYNPNNETVATGTGYAILAHDGISVQGLAQDVAETLRYYQSQETEVANAVDAFNNFDANDFDSKVAQVNTQHGDVVSIGAQVSSDAVQVSIDKNSASASAASASNDKNAAAISAQEAADYAASLDTQNLLRKDLSLSDLTDKAQSRVNLDTLSSQEVIARDFQVAKQIAKDRGFLLLGIGNQGVTLEQFTHAVVSPIDGRIVYRVTDLPYIIQDGETFSSGWIDIYDGIMNARTPDIERLLASGEFSVSKDADIVTSGTIPGAYPGRLDRNFSDGQSYKYGSQKFHKFTYGIFEDACVLSAISSERNLERSTQILGTNSGKGVAQYGTTDTAATYFENYALPPIYSINSGTVFTESGASGLSINQSLIKVNMVAEAVTGGVSRFGLIKSWSSSSITVDGWYERTSGNQSTPPDGSIIHISPVSRVWGNNTIVTVPVESYATSAVGMEAMLNLYKSGVGVDSQIYKAINNNAFNPDEVVDSAYQSVGKFMKAHDVWPGSNYAYRSWGAVNYGFFSDHDVAGIKVLSPTGPAFVMATQVNGVGEESNRLIIDSAGSILQNSGASLNATVAAFGYSNGAGGLIVKQQTGQGASQLDSAVIVGGSATTGRSINCAGTVNTGGTDYAEYMIKSQTCGDVKPGDICGIDRNGFITDSYEECISFVVKSTNPSFVGGDNFSSGDAPRYPSEEWVAWSDSMKEQKPIDVTESLISSVIRSQDISEDEKAEMIRSIKDAYSKELQLWESRIKHLSENEPDKESDEYKEFNLRINEERIKRDRIAFCGQVPVNISADIGDIGSILVPISDEGRISAKWVRKDEATLSEYMSSVGTLIRINGEYGKPEIMVKIS